MFAVAAGGCASTKSTVESRKLERLGAYESLSAEQQELVDQGLIQAGMPPDAVYISWGKPAQVLQSGNQSGVTTTWLYHGTTTDEYLGWSYYQTPSPDGGYFLSRRLDRDYNTREYISAELTFRNGELLEWKMLPKPSGNTIYRGYP